MTYPIGTLTLTLPFARCAEFGLGLALAVRPANPPAATPAPFSALCGVTGAWLLIARRYANVYRASSDGGRSTSC